LETVFSVGSAPGLYNEDSRAAEDNGRGLGQFEKSSSSEFRVTVEVSTETFEVWQSRVEFCKLGWGEMAI
jgi:hypothetical protein